MAPDVSANRMKSNLGQPEWQLEKKDLVGHRARTEHPSGETFTERTQVAHAIRRGLGASAPTTGYIARMTHSALPKVAMQTRPWLGGVSIKATGLITTTLACTRRCSSAGDGRTNLKGDTVPSKSTESTGHRLKWAGRHGRQTESFGKKERKVSQTGLRVEMLLSCRSSRFFPFCFSCCNSHTDVQMYRWWNATLERIAPSRPPTWAVRSPSWG